MHNTSATSPSEPTPCPLLGDLRIQHTVMASVHLSYGDDLQMDWDGRGRLLVKVGPFPSYSLPGARPLQSTPCALGKMALCGRRRISFSSHSTPPEQGTGLSVCERLMSVSWVLLVGPGASSFWGLGIVLISRMDVSPLEYWHRGISAGQFPGSRGVPGHSLWGAREETHWSTQLRPSILPYSIWREPRGDLPHSLLRTELIHVWAMSSG